MKNYYRIMLGRNSVHAELCREEGFIGADYNILEDLKDKLPEDWREFNKAFIPVYLKNNPEKTKIAAGLSCGALYTISKGIKINDIVLSPNGLGYYYVGIVTGNYRYAAGGILPHRRDIVWMDQTIKRADMTKPLQFSTGSIGAVSNISKYEDEIEKLIKGEAPSPFIVQDESIEDPTIFALEKHLEDFLVQNWSQTELGKNYDIYEVDGELVGQQFHTDDTGDIDILAISKDKKELLIIELKKGRASDKVIGQIQRYMGYVKEELADEGQTVKGIIIALEDDKKIKRALVVTNNIEFYRYIVNFKLIKA